MKKGLFLIFTILTSSIICSAQDMIVRQDGNSFIAYILDITDRTIYFTLNNSDEAEIQKISKSDVLIIKYKDGRTRQFYTEDTATSQQLQPSPQNQSVDIDSNRSDTSANTRVLDKYTNINGEIPTRYAKLKADASLLHYAPTSSSVLCNKDIEINYILNDISPHISNKTFYNPECKYDYLVTETTAILVTIENKTDQFIYLDLAKSYFKIAGIANPYYTPSAISKSESSTGGGSLNLGGVTNALGIGGVVGDLANAVNIGTASSETISNINFSQRIVSVPPHGRIHLKDQLLFPGKSFNGFADLFKRLTAWGLLLNPIYKAPTVGSIKHFREGEVVSGWGTIITYGFTEDLDQTFSIQADFYLKSIYGFRQGWYCSSQTDCYKPFKDVIVIECINRLH